jgi:hypothetical protein
MSWYECEMSSNPRGARFEFFRKIRFFGVLIVKND